MQSQGFQYVQQIVEREIGQMGGRADKLFICGVGEGGQLAMLTAFHSQHILGGAFCLDSEAPDTIIQHIQSAEGAAIYPQYEAKKNMFLCITAFKGNFDDAAKQRAQQQAQLLRGNGFLRTSMHKFEKSMDRAMCQVHGYSRLGSLYEVDRMKAFREARTGKYDKQAQAKNAPTAGQ